MKNLTLPIALLCAACGSDPEPNSSLSTAPMPTVGAPIAGLGAANAPVPTLAGGSSGSGSGVSAGGATPPSGAASAAGMGGGGAGGPSSATSGSGGTMSTGGSGSMLMPTGGGGGGMSMGGSGMSMGGSGGSTPEPRACTKGEVKAAEVVFIGESFIAASGAIPRFTSQLARDAGTIGASESYRSYAVSGTLLTSGDIPGQYTRAVGAGPVKVVLMDGGGNDLLVGGRCKTGFDASCKEIVTVVQTLFAKMKEGGVKDVVYFFYPDPMGIGASIKGAMDILRPEMKKACDGATDVRCVWVDQRESWEGKYATYTMDGIHPTDAGSMASAKQIWEAMVASCIAQ